MRNDPWTYFVFGHPPPFLFVFKHTSPIGDVCIVYILTSSAIANPDSLASLSFTAL